MNFQHLSNILLRRLKPKIAHEKSGGWGLFLRPQDFLRRLGMRDRDIPLRFATCNRRPSSKVITYA